MSNEMTLPCPSELPRWLAAITPAAGPDSTMNTGRSMAASNVSTPPLLCMTSSSPVMPEPRILSWMFPRYRETTGRMAALITVVLARKYSLNSGATSDESDTGTDGRILRKTSPMRLSCAGLT